jgi:hypothetical protein
MKSSGSGYINPRHEIGMFMMPAPFGRLAAVSMLLALAVAPAFAGERPRAVVELFTSQGCNSCPPADANFADLASSGDIIALAYHVDYWDYLGWRDTFGRPENTARQQEYGRAFDVRSVYTPQAVINGRAHVNGAKRYKIDQAMAELDRKGQGLSVDVDVSIAGESVLIEAGPGIRSGKKAHIVLVCFDKPTPMEIGAGENAGSRITYYNPVLETVSVGMWDGTAKRVELPLSDVAKKGPGGCAVLLQKVGREGMPGPILGAAMVPHQTG